VGCNADSLVPCHVFDHQLGGRWLPAGAVHPRPKNALRWLGYQMLSVRERLPAMNTYHARAQCGKMASMKICMWALQTDTSFVDGYTRARQHAAPTLPATSVSVDGCIEACAWPGAGSGSGQVRSAQRASGKAKRQRQLPFLPVDYYYCTP
jgi:hypothetical protein